MSHIHNDFWDDCNNEADLETCITLIQDTSTNKKIITNSNNDTLINKSDNIECKSLNDKKIINKFNTNDCINNNNLNSILVKDSHNNPQLTGRTRNNKAIYYSRSQESHKFYRETLKEKIKMQKRQNGIRLSTSSTERGKTKGTKCSTRGVTLITTKKEDNSYIDKPLTSSELRLISELKECTFKPKITKIDSYELKKKLKNYSQFSMYEKGQFFQMKKRQDTLRMFAEQKYNFYKIYKYKPEVHKCPEFNKVSFPKQSLLSTREYFLRMEKSRILKEIFNNKRTINKKDGEILVKNEDCVRHKRMLSARNNGRNIRGNSTEYENKDYMNNIKKININVGRNVDIFDRVNSTRTLTRREEKEMKKNIHNVLMSMRLDEDDDLTNENVSQNNEFNTLNISNQNTNSNNKINYHLDNEIINEDEGEYKGGTTTKNSN